MTEDSPANILQSGRSSQGTQKVIFISLDQHVLLMNVSVRIVLKKAHAFLTNVEEMSSNDAARIMSLLCDLCVCQVVDPLKTMRFSVPKILLNR